MQTLILTRAASRLFREIERITELEMNITAMMMRIIFKMNLRVLGVESEFTCYV